MQLLPMASSPDGLISARVMRSSRRPEAGGGGGKLLFGLFLGGGGGVSARSNGLITALITTARVNDTQEATEWSRL